MQQSTKAIESRRNTLNEKIQETLDDCAKLHTQEGVIFDSMSDMVRDLALTLDDLYEVSDLANMKNNICGEIMRLFHEKGIKGKESLIRYALKEYPQYRMAQDLPEEAEERTRQKAYESALEASSKAFIQDSERLLASSKNVLDLSSPQNMQRLNEEVDSLKKAGKEKEAQQKQKEISKIRDMLRDFTEGVGQRSQELRSLQRTLNDQVEIAKNRCEQIGVAVDPKKVPQKREPVSAQPLLTGYSKFWKVVNQFIELWVRIRDKIWKYKPLTEDQAQHLADILEMQLEMDKPLADEKFRLEIVQWILAGAQEAMEGKHAASERFHYILPKQTRDQLDRLGEDVVRLALDPESGTAKIEMEKVAIVREEVGDVKEPMFRLTANILLMLIPRYIATVSWFIQHPGWSIAKRKQEAHEVLSDAA